MMIDLSPKQSNAAVGQSGIWIMKTLVPRVDEKKVKPLSLMRNWLRWSKDQGEVRLAL